MGSSIGSGEFPYIWLILCWEELISGGGGCFAPLKCKGRSVPESTGGSLAVVGTFKEPVPPPPIPPPPPRGSVIIIQQLITILGEICDLDTGQDIETY